MINKQDPSNKIPVTRSHIKQDPPQKPSSVEAKNKPDPDPYRLKKISFDLIPANLCDCSELIAEFWSVKKGTRSGSVFKRITNKLCTLTKDERQEVLERSIANGWGDVFPPRKQNSFQPKQDPSFDWDSLDGVSFFKQ